MLKFTITIDGLDEFKDKLGEVGNILDDLTPEFTEAGDYLVNFFSDDVFETEGSIIDEEWEPLTPSYERYKNSEYPGRGTLERTGTLRHSFEAQPSARFLILSNPVPYGVYHQFGTQYMPKRVFMKLDEERLDAVRDIIIEGLNERIKNA